MTRITVTLHEDQYTFFIICRLFLLRMRNVLEKTVGKIKTQILRAITFFKKNRAVYEITRKNNV